MKRKILAMILILILLAGCENQEETIKNEYIAMKSNVLDEANYTNSKEELPLDITVSIDRVGEETIDYKIIFENPKENMNQIKAMVVHNYYNEDVFPSIGVFDDPENLSVATDETSKEDNQLEIKGTIQTTKNLSQLNLELKIWLEYTTDDGEKKDIYYKTT